VDKLAHSIFRSFSARTFALLVLVFPFSWVSSRAAGALGVILGWAGMLVYLYWLSLSLGQAAEGARSGSHRTRIRFGHSAFYRMLFLLVLLSLGAGKGMTTFIWTTGMALLVFFCWLVYLVYWFYVRT
jgi:hypothetical protein